MPILLLQRCSSLERPLVANNNRGNGPNIMQRQCPSPIPAHVTKGNVVQESHKGNGTNPKYIYPILHPPPPSSPVIHP